MWEVFEAQGFKDIQASYHGGFGIWIEEARWSSRILGFLLRVINYARVLLNVLGVNTKPYSPYIVCTETK